MSWSPKTCFVFTRNTFQKYFMFNLTDFIFYTLLLLDLPEGFFFILANEFTPHKPNRAAVQTWAAIQIIPYHGSGLGVDLAAADLPLPYCCLGEACGHGQEALPILGQREVKCLDASCAIRRPKNGLVSFIYSVSGLYLLSPHWKDGWKALSHFLLRRITLSFFYFLLFHILAHWITVKIPIAL